MSGSATRTTLTQEAVRRGFFFRVVPPDAIQARSVSNYIAGTLRARNVYIIDDQEAYGVGLSDEVQNLLRARGVTVTRDSVNVGTATDFSSLVAKIGSGVNVVYIPWQIAAKAQVFGQQLREQGKQAALFGSDGLFDPSTFKITGAYVSFFPVARTSSLITQYRNSHGGDAQYFGAPTYAATQVVVNAVDRACRNGTATRAEVRAQIRRTDIAARTSVLGLRIRFDANGDIRGGRFGIFRVTADRRLRPGRLARPQLVVRPIERWAARRLLASDDAQTDHSAGARLARRSSGGRSPPCSSTSSSARTPTGRSSSSSPSTG